MTNMVQFVRPNIAIIGDTVDEVLELAESVIRRRVASPEGVVIQDCVSVDPLDRQRIWKRLDELRRQSRTPFVLGRSGSRTGGTAH